MQVRHPGRARRARVALGALVCAAALCGASGAVAQAKSTTTTTTSSTTITPNTPVTRGSGYLALGDSVSFGYMEPTVVPTPTYTNAASFLGYPEMLGSELGLKVANAACPGETSSSLINATAASNGCENSPDNGVAYRQTFPLHVKYAGSQLGYAVKYLKSHSNVRLVTLMIGANDGFLCQETTADQCASQTEQLAVLSTVEKNVHTILSTLRSKAHYNGQIVLVSYYSLDYASQADNTQSLGLNHFAQLGAAGFHVRVANAFATFQAASVASGDDSCTAGLLTQLGGVPGTCGVHPSYAGQNLLASTVLAATKLG